MAISPIGALSGIDALSRPAGIAAPTGAGAPGSIGSIGSIGGPTDPTTPGAAGSSGGETFLDSLGKAFAQLNDQLGAADATTADFAAGGSSDLHTVMLQMQEASLGLKVGVQVRDRLLEAYQELMRLQL